MRRVSRIGAHLTERSSPRIAAAQEQQQPDGTPDGAPDGAPVPLTEAQLAQFVVDGYVCIPLTGVPQSVHDAAAAVAAPHGEPWLGAPKDRPWGGGGGFVAGTELHDDALPYLDEVKRSPQARGAIASLLGDDFVCSPSAGGVRFATVIDQTYHKDGTASDLPVRDPLARELLCFYLPSGATADMGATAVIGGSPYFTVDREGYMQHEDRLIPELADPAGLRAQAARDGVDELEAWRDAMVAGQRGIEGATDPDHAEVDAKLDAAMRLIGPEAGIEERLVEVPPGSLVLTHRDLFHRGSRRTPTADPRPMWKFAAERASEPPLHHASGPSADPAELFGAARPSIDLNQIPMTTNLWESALNFVSGKGVGAQPRASADIKAAAKAIKESDRDVERTSAAYVLGNAIACSGLAPWKHANSSAIALQALIEAFRSPRESTRRAAVYGLAVAGPRAIPQLVSAIETPIPLDGAGLQPGGVGGPAGAAYALGGCAGGAEIGEMQRAVTALLDAIESAQERLRAYQAGHSEEELAAIAETSRGVGGAQVAMDAVATEHRRLIASAAKSVGILCHDALRSHAAEPETTAMVRRAVATLCELRGSAGPSAELGGKRHGGQLAELAALGVGEEPATMFPTYLSRTHVARNATSALLKICSGGGAEPEWGGVSVAAVVARAELAQRSAHEPALRAVFAQVVAALG